MDQKRISNTDLIILCGGQGTRIREISKDKPKILIDIGGRPFLDSLLYKLYSQGFRRIILSVGYLADKISQHVEAVKNNYPNLEIVFSVENSPLGTGGAVKHAEKLVKSDPFIVMNGDMIFDLNFKDFYKFHLDRGGILSMLLASPQEEKDYGIVLVDNDKRILGFKERGVENGLISAGTYIMNKEVFDHIKNLPNSLEYDFFPGIIARDCYGYLMRGRFIDIGTKERYEKARKLHDKSDS